MPLIMAHQGKTPVIPASAYLAPTATVIGDVALGESASLWFNVVVRGDCNFIRIGDRTNIQDNSTIHVHVNDHPTLVGNDVVGGHNILLHGCTIKDRILIGMGSTIMDGVVVGEESIVAAGSLLVPGTVVPPQPHEDPFLNIPLAAYRASRRPPGSGGAGPVSPSRARGRTLRRRSGF